MSTLGLKMIKHKKYILKIVGWFFLVLLLLFLGSGIYVYFSAENYVKKHLTEWVSKKSNHLYQLSFDDIHLTFIPLSFTVSNVSLITDPEVSAKVLTENPDKMIYNFHSSEIMVNQINFRSLRKNKTFHCKSINISEPELEIKGTAMLDSDSAKVYDRLFYELQPLFKSRLKKVIVDEINFINANYKLYSSAININQISNAENITVVIRKFMTDSALIFNESGFFDSEDILIEMENFTSDLGDSIHVLQVDTLEYSLKTTNILASGFHLKYINKDIGKNLYDVFSPKVRLRSKGLKSFTIGDSLDIEYLEFRNPEIKFYYKENPVKISAEDINEFDLYPLVKNQFYHFKVDSFLLENAGLEIFRQPDTLGFQQFKSINIELFDFLLDSVSVLDNDRLFHARNLEMNIHGYHLKLEDNLHEFAAGSIFVSTLSNTVGTKNIRITPYEDQQEKQRTRVTVECSELSISDVDLKTIYHTRILPNRLIKVDGPKVQIQYFTEIKRSRQQKEAGLLFDLVSAYLKGVYSEVVQVKNGTLKIENIANSKVQGYFETSFDFVLSGFALDKESVKQTDKFFYATNFDLRFNDYRMRLVDDLHRIKADSVSIVSSDQKLLIKNLALEPVISNPDVKKMEEYNRSELYKIRIPEIVLTNVNLREAFFYNKLAMTRFQITKPDIYFENFATLRQKKEKTEFNEFYQLLFNYIYDFNISEINVSEGDFTWVNHTRKGKTTSFDNKFSATLENLRLNDQELNKRRLLFSDNFDISLRDQVFTLSDSVHILQAGEISISTQKSQVDIQNAFLYPDITSKNYKRLSTTYQVSIPNLQFQNINFLKAYFDKELQLDKIEINAPKFRIYSRKGVVKSLDLNKFQIPFPNLFKSLAVNMLEIKNGQVITYDVSGTKQQAKSNFNIDLTLPQVKATSVDNRNARLATGNLIARIHDFKTPLGKQHELNIDEMDFNREQKSVGLTNFQVIPYLQIKSGNLFSVLAPKISLTGFDINQAMKNNYFIFDHISLSNPDISIEITDSIKGDKLEFTKTFDLYPFVEPYVDKIEINNLDLNNVNLNFNWFSKELIDRRFNIEFNQINISENQPAENILHAKSFKISTTGLSKKSKYDKYEYTADSLFYNSENHSALLTNIKVKPLLPVEEFNRRAIFQTDYVKAKTSYIELKGVNENLWFRGKELEAEKLIIGKTTLEIFRNKQFPFNEKQRPPWPQDLLKSIKQPFVFDSVIIQPSEIYYSELSDVTGEIGVIDIKNLVLRSGQLSNINANIEQYPDFKATASTLLLNKVKLDVRFNFDLSSDNYAHSVTGSLEPCNMVQFNQILKKTTPLAIESGFIDRFDFDMKLDENGANGEIYFGYHDFKINIINLDSDEAKKSKLATFWANHMIFNSKNPKGNELLPETISYERDIQRSIINYWWKAILSGSKQSLGMKPDKE